MLLNVIFAWYLFVFFISGIFINILQFLTLPFFWIHRHSYHIIINKLCYCIYSQLTFLAEWWGNFDLKVYGTPADVHGLARESSIIVSNHFSDIDWLASYVFCERFGCLERTKCIMKNFVKYVPVMGWSWWFAEYGFIARNWDKDKASLQNIINGYCQSKVPFMISLFCEGTRRTKEKLKASQDYAREKDIVPLKYHLLPRSKGFSVMSKGLKGHIPAIYDVEMAFINPEKCTIATLMARGTVEVHIFIRRIAISEVPCETEEGSTEFIMELYRKKDESMEYFEKYSKFPAQLQPLPRKYCNLIVFLALNW